MLTSRHRYAATGLEVIANEHAATALASVSGSSLQGSQLKRYRSMCVERFWRYRQNSGRASRRRGFDDPPYHHHMPATTLAALSIAATTSKRLCIAASSFFLVVVLSIFGHCQTFSLGSPASVSCSLPTIPNILPPVPGQSPSLIDTTSNAASSTFHDAAAAATAAGPATTSTTRPISSLASSSTISNPTSH